MATGVTFRRTRAVVAVAGFVLLALATVWLFGPWQYSSMGPMIICLEPNDVACSDNFLLGRNGAEHLEDLLAGILGVAGALGLVTSAIWTWRSTSSARVS